MAVYLRIEGLSVDDLLEAENEHDESAAHDLADRVFDDVYRDYPALYEDLEGVVPVLHPEHDPQLLETTSVYVHREETGDSAVSDIVFCTFDEPVEGLRVPEKGSTTEWVETQVFQQFDGDDEALDRLVPTETEREARGYEPVCVGTLYYADGVVVSIDLVEEVPGDD